jgi:Tol biopolymer transport system component
MVRCRNFFVLVIALFLYTGCQSSQGEEYQLVDQSQKRYWSPVWSPDGQQILYTTQEFTYQFMVLDINSGETRELSINTEGAGSPSTIHWPKDGEISYSLSYGDANGETFSTLATYDLTENKGQDLLSEDRIFNACWNEPTRSYILLMQRPVDHALRFHGNAVVAYDPQGETLSIIFRVLGRGKRITDIACSGADGLVTAVVETRGSRDTKNALVVANIQTGQRRTIFETTNRSLHDPTWSPDGEWLAVREIRFRKDMPMISTMLISANGRETHVIMSPDSPLTPSHIAWSPLDNRLLISTSTGIPFLRSYSLYTIDLSPWLED